MSLVTAMPVPEHPAQRTQKTILSLVRPQSIKLQTSQSIMNTSTEPQNNTDSDTAVPLQRNFARAHLADEANMVHNALEAVRCLVMPQGTGYTASGAPEDMGMLSRIHFVDLLEIINDRLGRALEVEGIRF